MLGIIFTVTLLTVSIALYAVYYILSTNMMREQQTHTGDSLVAMDKLLFTALGEVDLLYTLAWTNNNVQTFVQSAAPDAQLKQCVDDYLRSMIAMNAYVESVALYNYQAQTYLYSGPNSMDMALFLSTYLLDMSRRGDVNLSKQKEMFLFTPRAADGVDQDTGGRSVISVVYYDLATGSNRHNCIAINLNLGLVTGSLLGALSEGGMLMNEYGSLIACPLGGEAPLSNRVRWARQVSAQARRTGHFQDVVNGRRVVVSYCRITEGNWILCQVSDDLSFQLFNWGMWRALVLITLISGAFSAALAFLISSRLYSPVKRIVSQLNGGEPRPYGDEFAFMNSMVAGLSHRIETLEIENTGYQANLKRDFLRQLLEGAQSQEQAEQDWSQYAIEVVPENLYVAVLRQDGSRSYDQAFVKLVHETALRCLENDCRVEVVDMRPGELALLMNPLGPELNLQRLVELLAGFGVPLPLSLGLAGPANAVEKCAECMGLARELLKQRFVLGYGHVITQQMLDARLKRGLSYPEELINELESNVRDADKQLFFSNYDRLLQLLSGYVYQDVANVLLQVITRCLHAMNSISVGNISLKVDFDEFSEIFSRMYTLADSRAWFSRLLDEYLSARRDLEELKDDRYLQMVDQIHQYVEANFADPALSVESIAEQFSYTANYTSRIYKNRTGSYLKDHIKRVRIEHAKELLKNTPYTILEISEMNGFSNYNYFFHSFKKQAGLTPTVYRNRFLAKNSVE
jgi:AraC-like DNA-binding protein